MCVCAHRLDCRSSEIIGFNRDLVLLIVLINCIAAPILVKRICQESTSGRTRKKLRLKRNCSFSQLKVKVKSNTKTKKKVMQPGAHLLLTAHNKKCNIVATTVVVRRAKNCMRQIKKQTNTTHLQYKRAFA